MGLLSFFQRKALTASPAVVEALSEGQFSTTPRLGGTNVNYGRLNAAFERAQAASYAFMYANQPAVRTVVDLIAENVSQLGLKLYERISDTERESAADHPAAVTLRYPNDTTPADQFIFDLVADYLIYNNAYALKFRTEGIQERKLVRVPAHMIGVLGGGFLVTGYRIHRDDGTTFDVNPEDMLHWRRYNPGDARMGLAPLETLRQVLVEDDVSQAASVELSKNGLQGGYIERPLEAPEWSTEAKQRFAEGWRNSRSKTPRDTPVLEEGMKFVNTMISPKDAELLAGREFTLKTVARLYGVPIGMFEDSVGRGELRQEFYSDVLAPVSKKLASQLDHSIVQAEYDETDYYFEFDLNEKLRGDPAQRFQAITSAVGAPWLLRDEARAKENLPPLEEGGDEIVTPLNVLVGDNPRPAPNVMPPQNPNGPPQDGSHREELTAGDDPAIKALGLTLPRKASDMARQRRYVDEATALLSRFYKRQLRTIKSKATFDSERWNRELAGDLEEFLASLVEREGGIYVARLAGDDFDTRQVRNYIKAQARSVAENLNTVTQRDFEGDRTAREALERAANERALAAGTGLAASATVFARREAAKQAPFTEHRRQVWVANTERHAELDGVAVPLGSDWGGIEPGSEPGCGCTAVIE